MRPICVMPVMMVHTMQAALSLWFYHYDDDDHDDHHGHKKTHDKKHDDYDNTQDVDENNSLLGF